MGDDDCWCWALWCGWWVVVADDLGARRLEGNSLSSFCADGERRSGEELNDLHAVEERNDGFGYLLESGLSTLELNSDFLYPQQNTHRRQQAIRDPTIRSEHRGTKNNTHQTELLEHQASFPMSNAAAKSTNCSGSLGDVVLHSSLDWSLLAKSWIGVNSSFCLYTTLGLVDGQCRSAPHLRNAKVNSWAVCFAIVLC